MFNFESLLRSGPEKGHDTPVAKSPETADAAKVHEQITEKEDKLGDVLERAKALSDKAEKEMQNATPDAAAALLKKAEELRQWSDTFFHGMGYSGLTALTAVGFASAGAALAAPVALIAAVGTWATALGGLIANKRSERYARKADRMQGSH